MDLPLLRGLMSLAMLVTFLGLFLWVFRGSKRRFEDAAALPFADDSPTPTTQENPKP